MNTAAPAAPVRLSIGERGRFEWERALLQSGLPPLARLIALTVALFTDARGEQDVWLGVPDLMIYTGMTAYSVRRYLALVEQTGWLHSEARDARGTPVRFLSFPEAS